MQGIYTALATPFGPHGEIDFRSLEKILIQQVRAGIRGFVICGTTGENSTLSKDEKEKLFRFVAAFAEGKELDLVAGTGTNDTRESVSLTRLASELGYRKFLLVVPYYNKPSEAGLIAHFEAIADSLTDGLVVLYNVPSRTGLSLSVEAIVTLAAHPRIRAIKEASGDLKFLSELQAALRRTGRTLSLLSGDDLTYFPFLTAGGHGVISVSSHVCPRGMLEIEAAVRSRNLSQAERLQNLYLPLFRDLFLESNPGPLKWMLAQLGLAENRLRLPLVPVGKATETRLAETTSLFRIEGGEYRR